MSNTDALLYLPAYHDLRHTLTGLNLPISISELHGVLCGYLAVGESHAGETYLRALLHKQRDARDITLALFNVYAISQQQMNQSEFELQLLLPDEDSPLPVRARAFSEWCEGFTQGLITSSFDFNQVEDEDMQDAIHHITEFGQLDYQSVQISEDDERALMEVTEYTRIAVSQIYLGVQQYRGSKHHEAAH